VLAVSYGAFLTSLDAGAVNAVLPLIRLAFGGGIERVQWVLEAELLATSGLLLIFGRLGDRVGARAVYLAGFAVFLCGCVLCGAAPKLGWLVAFRVLQGIGTAMLLANSASVLTRNVPEGIRGSGFGTKASCLYLGLMAGPAAGGWLAGRFGWRAMFAMEVPVAIAGFAIAAIAIPGERPSSERARYDFAGAGLWCAGLSSFLWLLGHRGLLAAAVLLLGIGLTARRRDADALLAFSLRNRRFAASALSLAIAFTTSYMMTFVLPFVLLEVRHQSPSAVGRVMAVYALARASVAWWSGRRSDRMDARLLTTAGMMLFVCGAAMLSRMDESRAIPAIAGALGLAGLGFGCFVPPNNNTLMGSAPRELCGFAAGIMATARTVGMTAGVALAGGILSSGVGSLVSRAGLAFRWAGVLGAAGAIASGLGPLANAPRR
jgi:MFS family permease